MYSATIYHSKYKVYFTAQRINVLFFLLNYVRKYVHIRKSHASTEKCLHFQLDE